MRSDYRSALLSIRRAEGIDSLHPDIPYVEGLIRSHLYEFEAADDRFLRALALDPSYLSAWYQIGQNAFLQTRYSDAVAAYKNELKLMSEGGNVSKQDLAVVHGQIGRSWFFANEIDSARVAFAKAVELDPSSAQNYAWKAELLRKIGEYEEAIEASRTAFRLDSTLVENAYVLGALLLQKGETEEAEVSLRSVLRRDPAHEGATYNLGRLLVGDGRAAEGNIYLARTDSLQWLKQAIGSARHETFAYPDDPERWLALAELLAREGDISGAREAAEVERYLRSTVVPRIHRE